MPIDDPDFIFKSEIARELRLMFNQPCPAGARKLCELAAADKLPMIQRGPRRMWGAWRRDLPEIGARLGMHRPETEQSDRPATPIAA